MNKLFCNECNKQLYKENLVYEKVVYIGHMRTIKPICETCFKEGVTNE
jgi:hypothetical protein